MRLVVPHAAEHFVVREQNLRCLKWSSAVRENRFVTPQQLAESRS
jgi:hypothetical protein